MHEMPYETYYRAIFLANAVIDDVMDSEQDSAESKEQIMGEAYAIRAYSHFDLVNLYGKAYDPVTAACPCQSKSTSSRNTVQQVWKQFTRRFSKTSSRPKS